VSAADEFSLVEAKILRLEPGDIIALRYPRELSVEQAQQLKELGEAAFRGHTVAVLSGDIDVVIVREPEPLP
jgi:hypothetical protein